MPRPAQTPIGMELAGVARDVGRAFDAALAREGGSRPMWLVLLSLKSRPTANQRELAAAVGIQDATLTHHLNGMEAEGLLTRRRENRFQDAKERERTCLRYCIACAPCFQGPDLLASSRRKCDTEARPISARFRRPI